MMNKIDIDLKGTIDAVRRKETPPPPSAASLRDWFAGIALSNPELMKDLGPEDRVKVAVETAERMMAALSVPRPPSNTKITVVDNPVEPTLVTMAANAERRERDTVPGIRAAKRNSIIPPPCPPSAPELPPVLDPKVATMAQAKPPSDGPGRYSYVTPKPKSP